jgi:hypothetical protein
VVGIDFRSYFTTIPHDKLIILIRQRVVDGSMLRLTVGIADAGKVEPTTVGVPQGSPISPFARAFVCSRSHRGGAQSKLVRTGFDHD